MISETQILLTNYKNVYLVKKNCRKRFFGHFMLIKFVRIWGLYLRGQCRPPNRQPCAAWYRPRAKKIKNN